MSYLFDNCISPRHAAMLAALGVEVLSLRELFPENIGDIELFHQLRDRSMVFVSADRRQTTRLRESRALKEAGLTAIWFGPFWSKKQFWDQAVWLVRRWPTIHGYIAGTVPGTCAEIRENGKAMPFVL